MIDTTAKIAANAQIGKGTIIEEFTVIAPNAKIGDECKIHRNIFIDSNVIIGNRVKIQDNVMIPHGVTLEDGVFVGPSVSFTNDKYPRSINPDGTLKSSEDWDVSETVVKYGASIGANATILCGVTLGEWCIICWCRCHQRRPSIYLGGWKSCKNCRTCKFLIFEQTPIKTSILWKTI